MWLWSFSAWEKCHRIYCNVANSLQGYYYRKNSSVWVVFVHQKRWNVDWWPTSFLASFNFLNGRKYQTNSCNCAWRPTMYHWRKRVVWSTNLELSSGNCIGRFGIEKGHNKVCPLAPDWSAKTVIWLSGWEKNMTPLPYPSYSPDLAAWNFFFVPMNENGPKRKACCRHWWVK